MRKGTNYLMAYGHFCSDFVQGTLSSVLPFLIAAYSLNYTKAAALVMVSNLVGSIIQPVFGHLSDRIDRPHLMTAGVFLAGLGMALVGIFTSYAMICAAVVVSGIGVAMFHPQGARMVNRVSSKENIGTNLGIFSFGGNAGFTLGPVFSSFAVAAFGLKGTLIFIVPSLVFAGIAAVVFRKYESDEEEQNQDLKGEGTGEDLWGPFIKLIIVVTSRSIIFAAFSTFLILYLMESFSFEKTEGSAVLSIYFAVTALSALAGGKLADRLGYRKTLIISFTILAAGTAVFAFADGIVLSLAALLPAGIGVSLGYSPMVTLGQSYLPKHVGFASGITLGFSVSVGGIIAPVLGRVGDIYGLTYSFDIVFILAAAALAFSLWLPKKS